MEKDSIEILIDFIMDITDDEFDYCIFPCDARYFFKNGGCLELAKVLKHFIPETKYVHSEKNKHFAALINDVIYDCDGINITIDDFVEISEEDLIYYEDGYGKDVLFEKKPPHETLINELNNIRRTEVLLKEINEQNKKL